LNVEIEEGAIIRTDTAIVVSLKWQRDHAGEWVLDCFSQGIGISSICLWGEHNAR
jgi:hypothetical protein